MVESHVELSPVIVALDFDNASEAFHLVSELGDEATAYKVGMQLLTSEGPRVARDLLDQGKTIFLDLKLHEIPNSVAAGVRAAGKLGASMVTVHASAGSAVLKAAVDAASEYSSLSVIALTVITSLRDQDMTEIGLEPSVIKQVMRLSKLSVECGCHGVVASADEAISLKGELPPQHLIVIPGVRLPDSAETDQARVTSPQQAAAAGATHITIGRAITTADSPRKAFEAVLRSYAVGRASSRPEK